MEKKRRLAVLSDMLYVPAEHVSQEALGKWTYNFEEVKYIPPEDVTRKCANCQIWGTVWTTKKGAETTCAQIGYTEDDYCNRFRPKPAKVVEEIEVCTWRQAEDGYYAFGRGDLGKIAQTFRGIGVDDRRVRPPLGFDLQLKEGRKLYPEQEALIAEWLSRGYGILQAPTGAGKAQPSTEPVLTKDGWKPIGQVSTNDLVYGSDGLLHKVVGVFPQGTRPIYELTFSDGSKVRSDIDHLWTFHVWTTEKEVTKTLKEWLTVPLRKPGNPPRNNLFLPMVAPIQYENAVLPLDPYTLGALLGDGGLSALTPRFTSMDDEIVSSLEFPAGVTAKKTQTLSSGRASNYSLSYKKRHINPLTSVLKNMGLYGLKSGSKFIPEIYKRSATEQRLAVLQGLFDTDGYVERSGVIDYLTKSITLADDVSEIVESLGGTASRSIKCQTYNGESREYARLRIKLPWNLAPVRLDRKLIVWHNATGQRPPYRALISVERVEDSEATCIAVSAPDQLYVTRHHILTHNTVMWCDLVTKLKTRTLLLAQEVRHLQVGWEGLYEHTNIAQLEEEAGEHLCGRLGYEWSLDSDGSRKERRRQGKIYPITFATFQSLTSEGGKKILEQITEEFGLVWLEEQHHEAASTFHSVTSSFKSFYRGGQSATPTRKDQLQCITYDTIGPVTALGQKEQMDCDYTVISTGAIVPDSVFWGQYAVAKLHTWISQDQLIKDCILQWMLYDIQCGRKPLFITERRAHAFELKEQLYMSGYNVELIIGGAKMKPKEHYVNGLNSGTVHAIIGTKVVKENVDIPPLDTVHLVYPNFGKETEQQVVGRIRRWLIGPSGESLPKFKPLIRVYSIQARNKVNSLPKKALEFRRGVYRKLGFTEIAFDAVEQRSGQTMRDLMED